MKSASRSPREGHYVLAPGAGKHGRQGRSRSGGGPGALRISKFEEVESCYLMSGGYDLLVFVSGKTLNQVATFISERLATIEGVLSTATHFLLRPYKEQNQMLVEDGFHEEKPSVSP